MRTAVAALDAAEIFETGLIAMDIAHEEWAKLKALKR
jgi:hypothetical protein